MDIKYQKLLKEIGEARNRQDALKYFNLCNQLGDMVEMPIEDEELYATGKADADYLSGEVEEDEDIETMARKEDSGKPIKIERRGFWKGLNNSIEREMIQKRNITGSIFCHVNGYVSIKGGWVAHLTYDFIGKKYRDIFVDYDHNVDVGEALASGLERLTYNLQPYPVKKTGSNGNIYYVKIGNFLKKDQPDPLDIFSREMGRVVKVWQMRNLLVRCWPKRYGEGRKTDLSEKPPWTIRRIFRNWIKKSR